MSRNSLAFHLAISVKDLEQARHFYGDVLGCREGRSTPQWVDFEFFGHQLSLHLRDPGQGGGGREAGNVDGKRVDIPHFGVVLAWADYEALVVRLRNADAVFLSPPTLRFPDRQGEQSSFFLRDPGGNTLEFKTFRDPDQLFSA